MSPSSPATLRASGVKLYQAGQRRFTSSDAIRTMQYMTSECATTAPWSKLRQPVKASYREPDLGNTRPLFLPYPGLCKLPNNIGIATFRLPHARGFCHHHSRYIAILRGIHLHSISNFPGSAPWRSFVMAWEKALLVQCPKASPASVPSMLYDTPVPAMHASSA